MPFDTVTADSPKEIVNQGYVIVGTEPWNWRSIVYYSFEEAVKAWMVVEEIYSDSAMAAQIVEVPSGNVVVECAILQK